MTAALPETVWVRIDGEPFLPRALAYRDAELAFREAWRLFGLSVGASAIRDTFPGSRPQGFVFKGKPPEGWNAADKHGLSLPAKRNAAAREAMASLPAKPRSDDVFGDALISELTWEDADGRCIGSDGVIGLMFLGPQIGWVGDVLFAEIPHAGNAATNLLARKPDLRLRRGVGWTVPAGLTVISKAEIDLMVAQARVDAERAAA